jgi:DNA-binding MarR family transcriptional regulator
MAKSEPEKKKNPKEQLLELLEKKPPIYKEFVKYSLLCREGVSMSSFIEDSNYKLDKAALNELQESGFIRLVNSSKEGSETMVQLTEQARDEIFELFYSTKEKRILKSLFKKLDALKSSP